MADPDRRAFVPPPYPYDRVAPLAATAASLHGGAVDLSVGTPVDPPPAAVVAALASSGTERGYPPSIGTAAYRTAATDWLARRLGVRIDVDHVAACVGTKEFVTSLPHLLRLRSPHLDTVLYPAVSYPSYAMGATLAGCRAVPVAAAADGSLDLASIADADAERALCLWSNTPANPTGALDDLDAVRKWGRSRGVLVASDECYAEFTWTGPPRTALSGSDPGVLAVHSLSKRSNLAGIRAGFYGGDPELVHYLAEVRKHLGLMVPGPVQAAAVVAWSDDVHVDEQRDRYAGRLARMVDILDGVGLDATRPDGAFYLWVPTPGDEWGVAARLAERLGIIASPGEFYGPAGVGHVRLAMVVADDRLDLVGARAAALPAGVAW